MTFFLDLFDNAMRPWLYALANLFLYTVYIANLQRVDT